MAIKTILQSSKIYVAAVEGPAFGAGMGLATCCDLVVAAETARFCAAQIKVGASPDGAMLWTIPLRVGQAVARRLLLTGEEVDQKAACDSGDRQFCARDGALPAGQVTS